MVSAALCAVLAVLVPEPAFVRAAPFDSGAFWETRYKGGGNSGAGSYGDLARYKAAFLNLFVSAHNVKTVIEFGCGDGANLQLYKIPSYTGFDVSKTILARTAAKNSPDVAAGTKTFLHISEYDTNPTKYRAAVSISFDVLYHLIEDTVFDSYMRRLFGSAKFFVMIYSSDHDYRQADHVRHRKFTSWVKENAPEFEPYAFRSHNPSKCSDIKTGLLVNGDGTALTKAQCKNSRSIAEFHVFLRTAERPE
eukprot:m.336160 g.336160  ORF g.336160 m.336160 type:complete len:250 (+) comp27779_c2_seq2:190-939(+)